MRSVSIIERVEHIVVLLVGTFLLEVVRGNLGAYELTFT